MLWPIDITEYLLVRIQNWTGIPKYKWDRGLDLLLAIVFVTEMGFWLKPVRAFLCLSVTFIATALLSKKKKLEQDTADRTQLIVANPGRDQPLAQFYRISSFLAFLFIPLFTGEWYCYPFLVCVTYYVAHSNTFPMGGPTVRDRLRNWFRTGMIPHLRLKHRWRCNAA